jgi:hypothetical protein
VPDIPLRSRFLSKSTDTTPKIERRKKTKAKKKRRNSRAILNSLLKPINIYTEPKETTEDTDTLKQRIQERKRKCLSSRFYAEVSRSDSAIRETQSPTLGFLSFIDDSAFKSLETKKRKLISVPAPALFCNVNVIKEYFSSIPETVILWLVSKHQGNCTKALNTLTQRGWTPEKDKAALSFSNTDDVHFVTPYYVGGYPGRKFMKKTMKKAQVGEYFTYFRYSKGNDVSSTDPSCPSFSYFICYKNRVGTFTTKQMKQPNVPDVLFDLFDLTNGIPHSRQLSTKDVPGFTPKQSKTPIN